MRKSRFDKVLRVEEGEELTHVVVQTPRQGVKVYKVQEVSLEEVGELLTVKE